jgi:hypothetical protein
LSAISGQIETCIFAPHFPAERAISALEFDRDAIEIRAIDLSSMSTPVKDLAALPERIANDKRCHHQIYLSIK